MNSELKIICELDRHITPGGQKLRAFLVECMCGKRIKVLKGNLDKGHTKSCGCLKYQQPTFHGMRGTPIYSSWDSMTQRCLNPKAAHYHNYGARGISICPEWRDFKTFHAWATSHGWKAGLELDRADNDGNYEPENCRWVTRAENNLNKRTNRFVTFQGQTKTITEWAALTGLRFKTIQSRLDMLKWDAEKILTTPSGRSQGGKYAHLFRDIRTQL